ncbi:hypothetical protein FPB0191_01617 [Frischella perrara]|uniref:Uncharacterized protein n=1 Tax=Frischella perrara TaxID=1267021 RepID=A0A0A7S1Y6_FRIPE|nr:hypothetical protein [Frischella perrara]AJA45433.1 hypothetical protein FPB0191_01617 [Frischella perrara]
MKYKIVLFMLLSLIFNMPNAYSDEYFELDSIPEEYRFPKYNNIAHPPINIEYKGHKGTAMIL